MNTKKYLSLVIALSVAGSLALTGSAFAQVGIGVHADNEVKVTNLLGVTGNASIKTDSESHEGKDDDNRVMPAVVGKVSAINGTTLTVVSQMHDNNTYTVNASGAALLRGNTAIALSDIAVGDTIVVQGTVTGNTVAATKIRDGKVGNGNMMGDNNQALLQIKDNGQPVIAGTISAINGSTLTITNNSNVTYSVNAASANIVQGKNTIAVSGVKVGDNVIVQGAVNGANVTASTVIDTNAAVSGKVHMNWFGSIGSFFKHLFGF